MKIEGIDSERINKAGYIPHPKGNGYIRQVGRSRFHILEIDGAYDLHFDKTRNKIHYSRGCKDVVRGEARRIQKS